MAGIYFCESLILLFLGQKKIRISTTIKGKRLLYTEIES
ncbi:Uncharacterised protein [Legionella beliardensis]|uniref:Uncharacterized protein n=1 Tax=Legionella beliardensis TaxID=91822 RepID=A0A378I0U0_9GAMM|nr:Uncharacterised protein [Legionella beliardensis]